MAVKLITPLSPKVPIVDKEGNPTPYFSRILEEISDAKIAASVIEALGGDPDENRVVVWDDATGDLAFMTTSEVLDFITGASHGDILYRDSTGWETLGPGTAGQLLQTNGAGADPTWVTPTATGPSWALAGTGQTAVGTYNQAVDGTKANIDFIDLGSFNELTIICRGLTSSVSGVRRIQVSTNNGSSFDGTANNYKTISDVGVEANNATPSIAYHGTNSTAARSLVAHVRNLTGAVKYTTFNNVIGDQRSLYVGSANAINAIRINNHAGGNITGGTILVYAR